MNPQVDIDALTDAVCARLRDNFGHFVTVEAYREDRSRLPLPACLIELVDMEPADEDDGTEQLQMSLRFMATVIVGFREIKAKMAVRKLAADVAVCIHKWHFATGSQPAMVTSVSQENFMPELDKFEAWSVEFEVKAWLGKSVWDEESAGLFVPSEVRASLSPQVGSGAESEYVVLVDGDS